jgi:hypothetical protein
MSFWSSFGAIRSVVVVLLWLSTIQNADAQITYRLDILSQSYHSRTEVSSEQVAQEIQKLRSAYLGLAQKVAQAKRSPNVVPNTYSALAADFYNLERRAQRLRKSLLDSESNLTSGNSVNEQMWWIHRMNISNSLMTEEFNRASHPFLKAFAPGLLRPKNSSALVGPAIAGTSVGAAFLVAGLAPIYPAYSNFILPGIIASVVASRIPRAAYKAYRYVLEGDPNMELAYRQIAELTQLSNEFWKALKKDAGIPTPWEMGARFDSGLKSYRRFESDYFASVLKNSPSTDCDTVVGLAGK